MHRDWVDIDGLRPPEQPTQETPPARSAALDPGRGRFLSVHFRCCHAYGRLSRNPSGTGYEGRCPRCGRWARARIGPGGSSRRLFEAG